MFPRDGCWLLLPFLGPILARSSSSQEDFRVCPQLCPGLLPSLTPHLLFLESCSGLAAGLPASRLAPSPHCCPASYLHQEHVYHQPHLKFLPVHQGHSKSFSPLNKLCVPILPSLVPLKHKGNNKLKTQPSISHTRCPNSELLHGLL